MQDVPRVRFKWANGVKEGLEGKVRTRFRGDLCVMVNTLVLILKAMSRTRDGLFLIVKSVLSYVIH